MITRNKHNTALRGLAQAVLEKRLTVWDLAAYATSGTDTAYRAPVSLRTRYTMSERRTGLCVRGSVLTSAYAD